ncbi:MAG TPA: hypothetical protein VH062_15975 [Polyangiaceae bacterium]|jgi:hypothetical protein|nr:hypothetical protein [Polyangiaceae bacterium]
MRIGRPFAGILAFAGLLVSALPAHAHPPADDFLNLQKPGPHLTLMPFIGPGFRAIYDHRFELEKEVTELRTQVIGTVTVPFAEVSANVDIRLFLMQFGGTIGYHDEWHLLQFTPDPKTGRDRAGQAVNDLPATQDTTPTFTDLTRTARAIKDQNSDVQSKGWAFYEGRWGFLWPAYNFVGVSNLAFRHDGRPDVSYDWENGTVMNGGWNLRWEAYGLFRARNVGFIGPALRLMYVPRNRIRGNVTTSEGLIVPDGAACVASEGFGAGCVATHEVEVQYGILAGFRPNWVSSNDTFLLRVYTTLGQNNQLFGTQVFRQPLQLLFAYMVDFAL